METLAQDLRYALRTLSRSPAFAATAVLTLALGIGANTAIFTLVDALLLKPLPFPAADRLVVLDGVVAPFKDLPVSHMTLVDWRHQTQIFDHVSLYGLGGMNLSFGEGSTRLSVAQVTPDFFATLQVSPRLGRAFLEEEGRPGSGDVAVLSDGLWRSSFGGDSGIVGRTVILNGRPHRVVGVMPAGFIFPSRADLWIPYAIPFDQTHADVYRFVLHTVAIGRLRQGLSVSRAGALVGAVQQRYGLEHPRANPHFRTSLMPLRGYLAQPGEAGSFLLFGAVGVVLLIACANVAALLLARAAGREHEIALRAVLGASSPRLIRQLLSESLILACTGAGLGLIIALWLSDILPVLLPDAILGLVDTGPDVRVVVFVFFAAAVTTLLCGLAPAFTGRRADMTAPLHAGSVHGGRTSRPRLRRALVTAEIALALTLLVSAGVLLRNLDRLMRVDFGIRADHVLTADLALPQVDYPTEARIHAFYRQLLDRLVVLPGVRAVGAGSALPLSGAPADVVGVRLAGGDSTRGALHLVATPGYFAAMGIDLLAGRDFSSGDAPGAPQVAVITRSLADSLALGRDGIGAVLHLDLPDDTASWTVIGIVADTRYIAREAAQPTVYLPLAQQALIKDLTIAVRTTQDPIALAPELRSAIASVDPGLPPFNVRSMGDIVSKSLAPDRGVTWSLTAFGGLALLLAALGLYGVLAYLTTRRTREIGIRSALGASRRDVMRLILREGLVTTAPGAAIGLFGAWGVAQLLRHLVDEVVPTEPVTFAAATALLVAVAFVASWIPARRAARVDPMVALRTE